MNRKHFQSVAIGVVSALALVLGLSVSLKSWDGMIYFYTSSGNRNPAAIRRVFDFSNLEGMALKMASQERLMADAKTISRGDNIGIGLGHFVSKGPNGGKEFACRTYDKIEMRFTSGDTATSGEPAIMTVKGECRISRDINLISPIWIPVAQVLSQAPGDIELHFMEDLDVILAFENIGNAWPLIWNLESVRLYSSERPGLEVSVDRMQVEKLAKSPITLNWSR